MSESHRPRRLLRRRGLTFYFSFFCFVFFIFVVECSFGVTRCCDMEGWILSEYWSEAVE